MFISLPLHHSWNILEMNSGPLSHRMFFGFPLSQITFSSNLMTLSTDSDMEISCPTATLSQSSIIFSTRNVLPLCSLSLTKSIDHVVCGSDGITRGLLTRAGSLFKFLEPTDLAHLHAAVLALPIVQCRFGNAVIAGNCLGINVALKYLSGLHHLTLCVYFSFHRRKSNDFCLIQICPTNWEGYTLIYQIIYVLLFNVCPAEK